MGDNPSCHLLLAKAYLGLGELENCSKEAQKVIAACSSGSAGMSISNNNILLEAYVLRADSLSGMGVTEQASKYYAAAIQLDPDNKEVAQKLKTLRKVTGELSRLRTEIDKASLARFAHYALNLCYVLISVSNLSVMPLIQFKLTGSLIV